MLAYVFGIFFQYFSIAPMRGLGFADGMWAAVKADTLSLVAYEIGMFAWMAATQKLLFPGLEPTSWTFWFMMQIATMLGLATTFPMNLAADPPRRQGSDVAGISEASRVDQALHRAAAIRARACFDLLSAAKVIRSVGALTARAGVSQPAVSKHLGVLKQAGLVRDRHEGRQTHYSAQLGALAPLIDWTSRMAGFWQSRFDRLEDLLKRMDQ